MVGYTAGVFMQMQCANIRIYFTRFMLSRGTEGACMFKLKKETMWQCVDKIHAVRKD